MVLDFGFWFGKNWFDFGTSFPCNAWEFVSNYFAFGLAFMSDDGNISE